jgi:hypothetical protein
VLAHEDAPCCCLRRPGRASSRRDAAEGRSRRRARTASEAALRIAALPGPQARLLRDPQLAGLLRAVDDGLAALHSSAHNLSEYFKPAQIKAVYAAAGLLKQPDAKVQQQFILDSYDHDHKDQTRRLLLGTVFPATALDLLLREKRLLLFTSIAEMERSSHAPSKNHAVAVRRQADAFAQGALGKSVPLEVKVDPGFVQAATEALRRLAATPSGAALFGALYRASTLHDRQVVIYGVQSCETLPSQMIEWVEANVGDMPAICGDPVASAENRGGSMANISKPYTDASPITAGTPTHSLLPVRMAYLTGKLVEVSFTKQGGGQLIPTPAEALIGHELFHSLHHMTGLLTGDRWGDGVGIISPAYTSLEEQRAITGRGHFTALAALESAYHFDGVIRSENSLRKDLRGPERFGHLSGRDTLEETKLALGKMLDLPLEDLSDAPLKTDADRLRWFGGLRTKAAYRDLKPGDILIQRTYTEPSKFQSSILWAQWTFKDLALGSRYDTHVALVLDVTASPGKARVTTGEMTREGLFLSLAYALDSGTEVFPTELDTVDVVVYRPKDPGAAAAAVKAVKAIHGLGKIDYSFGHCMASPFTSEDYFALAQQRAKAVSEYVLPWNGQLAATAVKSNAQASGFDKIAAEGMQCTELVIYAYQVGTKPYIKLDARVASPARLEHYMNLHSNKFQFVGVIPAHRAGGHGPVELGASSSCRLRESH